jgi:hypothetical protein
MEMFDFNRVLGEDEGTFCPNCGSTECESNLLDIALYAEAAKEAPRLRHEGRIRDVIAVLSAYFARLIANFIRPRWRSVSCGVRYDG